MRRSRQRRRVPDPSAYVMQFGKHKGKPLSEIPAGYLTWILENVPTLYPDTRAAIEAYIGRPVPATSGEGQAAEPAARRPAPRRAAAPAPAAECSICGLAGTEERPLVHARCVDDGVPF